MMEEMVQKKKMISQFPPMTLRRILKNCFSFQTVQELTLERYVGTNKNYFLYFDDQNLSELKEKDFLIQNFPLEIVNKYEECEKILT